MENKELEMTSPKDKFYLVTVIIDGEGDNGKPKKTKEVHLVDGACPTEVEKKVKVAMDGTIFPWKIVNMSENKIQFVY